MEVFPASVGHFVGDGQDRSVEKEPGIDPDAAGPPSRHAHEVKYGTGLNLRTENSSCVFEGHAGN